jgi:CTP:molybdopterin cytidylyltransferase MocA
MTVAAVVLAPPPVIALRDEAGTSLVRVVADAALAGGAVPTIVVSPDPDGLLAAALIGSEARLVAPPAGTEPGIAWFAHGLTAAAEAVSGTSAALLWPGRHAWVDPETVTTLLEAHGVRPGTILHPTYAGDAGFPVLVPAALAEALSGLRGLHGPEAVARLTANGAPSGSVETGDPGVLHDAAVPRASLPPYLGPSGPGSGHAHEWGAAITDGPDPLG